MLRTLVLLMSVLGSGRPAFPIGFDFSKCQDGLEQLAESFAKDVPANMPHLTTREEQLEMGRRMARYAMVRKRAKAVKEEAQSMYAMAQLADRAFESAMDITKAPEQQQVATARQLVAKLLRDNLPRAAQEAATGGSGTREGNLKNIEQAFGPLEKIDGAHIHRLNLTAAEALVLSETRRLFLKKLIGIASHKENLDKATKADKIASLDYATSELRQVVNSKLLESVARDNAETPAFNDVIAEARELLQSAALPDFHRAEVEANIKFFTEFGITPVDTFTSYISGLKKIVEHNSAP